MNYDLTEPEELLEKRFRRLAKQWEEDPDTLVSSSITQISQHPDYQAIVAMGWDAPCRSFYANWPKNLAIGLRLSAPSPAKTQCRKISGATSAK